MILPEIPPSPWASDTPASLLFCGLPTSQTTLQKIVLCALGETDRLDGQDFGLVTLPVGYDEPQVLTPCHWCGR